MLLSFPIEDRVNHRRRYQHTGQSATRICLWQDFFREGDKPKVYASGGEIEKMKDLSDVPHKFSVDTELKRIQLCLDYHEWGVGDSIAMTLLPWAIEWLAHFEIWLTTGKWTGGGIHDGILED